jgi:PAS domain S-box-containing protein
MDNQKTQLFVLETDFRIVMVNKAFLENCGLQEYEVVGRYCHEIIDVWETSKCPFQEVVEEQKTVFWTKCLPGNSDGRYLEVMVSPVSVFVPEGQADFIIGTIRDITDNKRYQKAQLEKERLQGVIEMAGAAAHELNNPVFSALGYAQLLLEDISQSNPLYDDLTVIVKNLKVVSDLTRKMTGITSYKTKNYVGNVKIVDICESCDACNY